MKSTFKRYDKRDPTRAEMLLTRAGHHLWLLMKRLRAKSALPYREEQALSAALDTLWEAKRQVKREIKTKSAESFKKWQARKDFDKLYPEEKTNEQ